jgi:hypothetical protein
MIFNIVAPPTCRVGPRDPDWRAGRWPRPSRPPSGHDTRACCRSHEDAFLHPYISPSVLPLGHLCYHPRSDIGPSGTPLGRVSLRRDYRVFTVLSPPPFPLQTHPPVPLQGHSPVPLQTHPPVSLQSRLHCLPLQSPETFRLRARHTVPQPRDLLAIAGAVRIF